MQGMAIRAAFFLDFTVSLVQPPVLTFALVIVYG